MAPDERLETPASRRAHRPERDPRDIVTEYAFHVDPGLLGVPLAGPFRRLAAMLVDLFVLALLFPFRAAADAALGGAVDLVVALAVAWLLFRLAAPSSAGRDPGGFARFVLRSAGVVVALVGLATFAGELTEGDGRGEPAAAVDDAERTLDDLAGGIRHLIALGRAEGAEEAQPAADRIALELHRLGVSQPETEAALRELIRDARDGEPDWIETVVSRALARADSAARLDRMQADSLAVAYARAVSEGDTAGVEPLRTRLRDALAGERIEALESRNERLEDELEEAEASPGLVRRARALVTEDLGIGLGWLGLYFTAFLVLWDGRTPGKKLLGARVVNLSGEPLGWWDAFGRFGGYAAGLATGMLGYLQIAWDPNRQALHDRIAGTVVIMTRGPGERYGAGE